MKQLHFSKTQFTIMGSLVGVGLFNPMSVEILDKYFKMFYTGVFLVCTVVGVSLLLYLVFRPQKLNIPKKNKKSTKPQFIKTPVT